MKINSKTFIKTLIISSCVIVALALGILGYLFNVDIFIASIVAGLFIIVLLIVYGSIDTMQKENNKRIQDNVNIAGNEALNFGGIGIVVYSDDFEITWMSKYLIDETGDHTGGKLLNLIPNLGEVLNGEVDRKIVNIGDKKYDVNKIANNSVVIFKDITDEYNLNNKINDDAYVLGLVNYDNCDDFESNEDDITFINSNIKMPVLDYFKKFNCVYKTLKNNRLLLILNENIYKKLLEDGFSILKQVRKISNDANLDVTLSIAFSRGSDNLVELDEECEKLIDLAQTRGGDQVVVRKIGDDVSFFGAMSEAREKLNKTRVRVNVSALKDLVNNSSNVIIVGHNDADADCIGSALCVSNIINCFEKNVYILYKSLEIEPMIKDVMNKYYGTLSKKHKFISIGEAIDLINENTLIIMVDHHSKQQSNGKELLDRVSRVAIIDHHRRKAELDVSPLMAYIEASASSTCEMVCEFLPYVSRNLQIDEEEANIMYLGLMIDTDRFRVKTGARTFDVAKQLKQYGADPVLCDELSQEPYNMIINRSHIIGSSKPYKHNVVYAAIEDGVYNRSIVSRACDDMVKSKEVEAAFVICNSDKDEIIVSARSKGKINVQVIMEKMDGGGHMMAAGLQRKDTTVAKVENELINVLEEYFLGEDKNESNTTN